MVIAKVNGEVIDKKMLDKALTRYLIQIEEENSDFEPNDSNLKFLRAEVLQFLIERKLLLQLAREEGIRIEESELRNRISDLKTQFKDEREWEDNLLVLGTHPDEIEEELREDLILERFLDEIYVREIDVSEQNLKRYYEENESRMREPDLYTFYQILVTTTERMKLAYGILTDSDSKNILEKNLKRVGMELQHFTDLAEYKIPEEVLNVLRDLPEGKLGTMVMGEKDFLLFKLLKKREGRLLRFEDIKEQLEFSVRESGKKEIYQEMINREMDKAVIEYVDVSILENK